MLIEVKSQQNQASEPKGAKRFEFKTAEKLSRLPAYFALMVVGIAAYLRSLSPAHASEAEQPAERLDGGDSPADVPREQDVAMIENPILALVDPVVSGSVDGASDRRGLGVEPGNAWPGLYQMPDFPQLHFVEPTYFGPSVLPFVSAAVLDFPGNDNFGRQSGGAPVGTQPAETVRLVEPAGADDDDDDDDDEGGPRPSNRAPIVLGPVPLRDVVAGQIVLITVAQLLRGSFDPDRDALAVKDVTVKGAQLVPTEDGWQLVTTAGMIGPVSILYRVTDSKAWVMQKAELDIVRNEIVHGDGKDLVIGTAYDDDIEAGGGDDIIRSMNGNDHVEGGTGDDHIDGGEGNDVLLGGEGNDHIYGRGGNDLIRGGAGDDRLYGEDGDDSIFGEEGNDHLVGGAGNDRLDGGEGDDTLRGEDGADRLYGGEGDDVLKGGAGDDVLDGGTGNDQLAGEDGNDVLIDTEGDDILDGGTGDDTLVAGAGDDQMRGGDGYDTLDYSGSDSDLLIDLVGGISRGEDVGTDTITGFEAVMGGAGDDLLIVGGTAMVMSGGRGRDLFVFEVTDVAPSLSDQVVHKILDFVVGDRVRVLDYDLDRDARTVERDLFEEIYGDNSDDWLQSDVPLQVSHELIDDEDWTIIMADVNGDAIYDLAITIQGMMVPPPDHTA